MKTPERGALRQALLDEVKAVCATMGPEAVSIAQIGKRLGVSSGAPFRLFPSREHIFVALIESEMTELDQKFAQILAEPYATEEDRLTALCAGYLDHAHEQPAMFRLSFSLSAKALDASHLQEIGKIIYDKVRRVVAACLSSDAMVQEIEQKTYLLWSTIHGHAMLVITGQLDDQEVEIEGDMVIGAAVRQVTQNA